MGRTLPCSRVLEVSVHFNPSFAGTISILTLCFPRFVLAAGESDVKRLLLLVKNNDLRERWLGRLSQIAITREGGPNTSPTYAYIT